MSGDAFVLQGDAWDGWGTALKPAHEPIIMARKPLAGTVAANVLEHGTGAINVDGCRVAAIDPDALQAKFHSTRNAGPRANNVLGQDARARSEGAIDAHPLGRWPANVILDDAAGAMLDAQSGTRRPEAARVLRVNGCGNVTFGANSPRTFVLRADAGGGASRFFYCPKASRAERNAGGVANKHPTVKPIALMRWLVRLVTPPGGAVLDPFAGSGTTGAAAVLEGFDFVGVELDAEYVALAEARIAHWREVTR